MDDSKGKIILISFVVGLNEGNGPNAPSGVSVVAQWRKIRLINPNFPAVLWRVASAQSNGQQKQRDIDTLSRVESQPAMSLRRTLLTSDRKCI